MLQTASLQLRHQSLRNAGTAAIMRLRAEVLLGLRNLRPSSSVVLLWAALIGVLATISTFAATVDIFGWDLWLTRRIQAIDVDGFSRAGSAATFLSSPNGSAVAFIAAVTGLLALGQFRFALFAAASAWTHLIGGTLKVFVDRPRPPGELVETVRFEPHLSFPSGHVEWVVGFEGFLLFALWQLTPSRTIRWLATGLWSAQLLLTSVGRIDQGLHWGSDILGGLLVGALALSVTVWAYLASKRAGELAEAAVNRERHHSTAGIMINAASR